MAPLVGHDEGPLERQNRRRDERLEEKRIGHAIDRRTSEVPVEQREWHPVRQRRHRGLEGRIDAGRIEPFDEIRRGWNERGQRRKNHDGQPPWFHRTKCANLHSFSSYSCLKGSCFGYNLTIKV